MHIQTHSDMMGRALFDRRAGAYVVIDTTFTAELGDGLTATGSLDADTETHTIGFASVTLTTNTVPLEPDRLRRIPWSKLLRGVVDQASISGRQQPDGTVRLTIPEGPHRSVMAPRRRRVLDDDHYRQVADTYRKAVVAQTAPVNAVAAEMHTSRSTAGRWVAQARERGFLGSAPARGVEGEA